MRLSLPLLAAAACLVGGSAFAQTAPSTDRSGGPTATAGTSAQSNRPGSDASATTTSTTTTYSSDAAPASAGDAHRSSNRMTGGKITPDPSTDRSGGPTATAGTSDKSNATHGPAPNNSGQ